MPKLMPMLKRRQKGLLQKEMPRQKRMQKQESKLLRRQLHKQRQRQQRS
jgi:hypothetical protein